MDLYHRLCGTLWTLLDFIDYARLREVVTYDKNSRFFCIHSNLKKDKTHKNNLKKVGINKSKTNTVS